MDGAVGRHHPRLTPAPPLPIAVRRTRMRTSSAFKLPSVYLTIYLSICILQHVRRCDMEASPPSPVPNERIYESKRSLSPETQPLRSHLSLPRLVAGKICSVGKMTAILWKRPPRPLTIKAYQFQAKVWLNIGKSCKTVMLTASYRGLRT